LLRADLHPSSELRHVPGGRITWAARVFAASTVFYYAALYVYVPILPVYAQALAASLATIGLVVSAYGAGQLLLRIPVGIVSDRWGQRKPFCAAVFLFGSLASLVLLVAPSPGWLVVGRGIAGVSAAAWVAITVLYSEFFPSRVSSRAMAELTVLSGLAQLLATAAGGWLSDGLGWPAPFMVGIGLGLVGAGLVVAVPEARRRRVVTPSWTRTP
jgi:MFS family permease